jgi:hypothetical protein
MVSGQLHLSAAFLPVRETKRSSSVQVNNFYLLGSEMAFIKLSFIQPFEGISC